jgi:hypothetical protein
MNYIKIYLFGKRKSRGSFDDFYSTEKYDSLEQAYEANDYVECDFLRGDDGLIYIDAKNVKKPEDKDLFCLNYQNCPAGIDVLDDNLACEMAQKYL